ncbi:MAG: hypothetical protein VX378_01650 [Pseudomonadota bacterium]|nr:hypothetical protein [Pseudomonadota bacterium]MEE3069778.1 hypothetical protein [Pseudomonadota bacterium]
MMGTLAGLEMQRATGWVALWKSVSGDFSGGAASINMLCAAQAKI